MENSGGIQASLAGRYATALFELARDNNAIDAVKDLPEKWIEVILSKDSGWVVMQVIDSGSGITKDIEEKLFQPFFTTKKIGEGTGLGLSISQAIARSFGGEISVESTVGAGATFTLVLPYASTTHQPRRQSQPSF